MKILILMATLFASSAHAVQVKKILMIVNEGFQVDEYYTPRKLFEQQGYQIQTASRFGGMVHPGRKYPSSKSVDTQYAFNQVQVDCYDAITFAGGAGAWTDYFPNSDAHRILLSAIKQPQITVGLICAAAGLLATAGNLGGQSPQFEGRNVTGYPEVEGLLRQVGKVQYSAGDPTKPYAVTDGNLITARDPISAQLFAETLVQKLSKKGE